MAAVRDFVTGELLKENLTRREARIVAERYWRDGRRVLITEDPQEQELLKERCEVNMTVEQLIKILSKFDPKAEVRINYPNDDQNWAPHLVIEEEEIEL